MPRTLITWVMVGAVVALIVVAAVDAFLSSDPENAQAEASALPRTQEVNASLTPCAEAEIRVFIDMRGGIATAVVQNVGDSPCHLRPMPIDLTVEDRAGERLHVRDLPAVGGNLQPGFQQTTNFPEEIPDCRLRGPFIATATVGARSATRVVPGRAVGC